MTNQLVAKNGQRETFLDASNENLSPDSDRKQPMRIEQPVFPLALSEFVSALRTGHGRVMQQLQSYGSNGLEDKIIEACVTCLSYDPQCEAARAPWLFSLIDCVKLKAELIQAIDALMHEPPPENHRDLDQRSAVLKELAASGSDKARRLLYLSLARLSDTADVIAADHIVSLDGVNGLTYVARQFGCWLKDDPDFWVDDSLIGQFDESVGGKQGLAALEREATSDPNIAHYLAGLRRTRELRNDKANRFDVAAYTGAQIVALVNTDPKDQCHWFRGWGMRADTDQRESVFLALLDTNEPERVKRLLRCFGKTGVPRFDSRLLQWIPNADEMLRWAAVKAVAPIRHKDLREVALQLIFDGDMANGVRLLVANFEEGDLSMCAKQLERLDDVDQRHRLGSEVLELCEAHPCADALDCLLYVYEFSPCSTCRRRTVKALIDMGIAPAWLLRESALDADPDTRALAI